MQPPHEYESADQLLTDIKAAARRRGAIVAWVIVAVVLIAAAAVAITLAVTGRDDAPAAKPPSAWDVEQAQRSAAAKYSPSPSTVTAASRYETGEQLISDLDGAGILCANYKPIDDPIGAVERGSCNVAAYEVTVGIYADQADAAAHADEKAATLGDAGLTGEVVTVVGGNWTLGCDERALCERLADEFGGELVAVKY